MARTGEENGKPFHKSNWFSAVVILVVIGIAIVVIAIYYQTQNKREQEGLRETVEQGREVQQKVDDYLSK
jgi:hypothetical protein